MAVYVDNMRMPATVGTVTARWSHLMADTDDELHAFAARIGLQRRWAQYPGTWKSHYDVTDTKRRLAIAAGAIEIGYGSSEAIELLRRKQGESVTAGPVTAGQLELWTDSPSPAG